MSKAITRLQAAIVIVIIVAAVAIGAYVSTTPTQVSQTTAQSSSTSAVPNLNTLTYETIGQPDVLDPAIDYEIYGGQVLPNIYENLLFFSGADASAVVPWLAQSYTVSPDGLTYTFHIRPGIKFSDGTPLDANAVYYSLMRPLIIDDPDGPAWAMLQAIRGGQNYSKSYNNAGPSAPNGYGSTYTQGELQDLLNAKPVEVIDNMTVAIHLEHPYAGWPFIMAFSVTSIVDPTAFKAHWTAPTDGTPYIDGITAGDYHDQYNPWPATNVAGTGPYTLESWDKASQTLVLVSNPNYWGTPSNLGPAPIQHIVIKAISDLNTRVLDFKGGEADIADTGHMTGGTMFQFIDQNMWLNQGKLVSLSPDYAVYPQCPPAQTVNGVCLFKQFNLDYIGFNEKIRDANGTALSFQPFSDIRLRKAFTFAFNRTSFLHDVVQDFAIPGSQIVPAGMYGYDPTIQPTPYDPATAEQLILDAGAHPLIPANGFSPSNPKTIYITYNLGNSYRETAAVVLANTINNFASDTGLYAQTTGLEWSQYLHAQRTHQLMVSFPGWSVDYVDPDDFLVPLARSTGVLAHRVAFSNATVDKLVDEEATMPNGPQRLQVINQIERMVNGQYVYCWIDFGASWSLARSWVHERANATVASGLETANPAIAGYYYYMIQKGDPTSPDSVASAFLSTIQLPAAISFPTKKIL